MISQTLKCAMSVQLLFIWNVSWALLSAWMFKNSLYCTFWFLTVRWCDVCLSGINCLFPYAYFSCALLRFFFTFPQTDSSVPYTKMMSQSLWSCSYVCFFTTVTMFGGFEVPGCNRRYRISVTVLMCRFRVQRHIR
jgi:hypothetical protein